MQLTETQKFLLRYSKNGEYNFDYKDIIAGGLDEIYSYHMKLGNVHTVVYRVFKEFCLIREFQIPLDAEYEVLTSVAQDFDYRYKGVNTASSVEDVLQSQLSKMMMFIALTNVGWLNGSYKE